MSLWTQAQSSREKCLSACLEEANAPSDEVDCHDVASEAFSLDPALLQEVHLDVIAPAIDVLVRKHMSSMEAAAGHPWPPVIEMSEDEGCAAITGLLNNSARDIVTEALGPITHEQESYLTCMVERQCLEGFWQWRGRASKDTDASSSSFSLAPVSKRGMSQSRKRNKKNKH